MRLQILGLVAAIYSAGVVSAFSNQEARTKATELARDQARTIVSAFLKSKGYKTESPKFGLENESDDPKFPDFYMFHAYFDTDTRLNSIGAYGVNRRTATLWERIGCEELKSSALGRLQSRLRRQLAISDAEFRQKAKVKPCL